MEKGKSLDLVLHGSVEDDGEGESSSQERELRRGDLCPQCRQGRLDYDGLLNLSCEQCGFTLGGCFT